MSFRERPSLGQACDPPNRGEDCSSFEASERNTNCVDTRQALLDMCLLLEGNSTVEQCRVSKAQIRLEQPWT